MPFFSKNCQSITFLLNVPDSCLTSLVSCLKSHVSHLLYHISCLTPPVSCILSHVYCLKSSVLRQLSNIPSLISSLLSPDSCLPSLVSRLLPLVICLLSHISCLTFFSISRLTSHVSCLTCPALCPTMLNCFKQKQATVPPFLVRPSGAVALKMKQVPSTGKHTFNLANPLSFFQYLTSLVIVKLLVPRAIQIYTNRYNILDTRNCSFNPK